jgi:hypothetical protein
MSTLADFQLKPLGHEVLDVTSAPSDWAPKRCGGPLPFPHGRRVLGVTVDGDV